MKMARPTLINRVTAFTVPSTFPPAWYVATKCLFPSDWSDKGMDHFIGLDFIQLRPLGGADLRRSRLLAVQGKLHFAPLQASSTQ